MTNNKDRDEDDALMQSFRLLREDVPEGLHSRIVQVATHMPQHKVAPAEAAPHGLTGWLAGVLPDMRMAWAFGCTVVAIVGLLGLHVGQSQTATMAAADEAEMVIYSIIDGDIAWEEMT